LQTVSVCGKQRDTNKLGMDTTKPNQTNYLTNNKMHPGPTIENYPQYGMIRYLYELALLHDRHHPTPPQKPPSLPPESPELSRVSFPTKSIHHHRSLFHHALVFRFLNYGHVTRAQSVGKTHASQHHSDTFGNQGQILPS